MKQLCGPAFAAALLVVLLLLIHPAVAEDYSGPPLAAFHYAPSGGSVPLTVQFYDDTIVDPTTPTYWLWDFGDGWGSSAQNPTHTYTEGGDFTVILEASNAYGFNQFERWVYAYVDEDAPSADFYADPTTGTVPLTVQFYDESSETATSWSWEFGDGFTSTSQNPTHTYNSGIGTYTVTLTVTNDAGEDTETKTGYITVADTPAFTVSASPSTGTVPLAISFYAVQTSSTTITSWSWTFGDGNTSTEQNPTHTYAVPGTYTVTCTGSHAYGSTLVTRTEYIRALPGPIVIHPNINTTKIEEAVNNYDPPTGGFTRYWLSDLTEGFPVYGFVFSIVAPFVDIFGYWFFVILWFVYLGGAYLRTGSTTLPLVVGLITGSVWGAIMPAESHLIAYVLLAISAVGLLMKIYVRDRL